MVSWNSHQMPTCPRTLALSPPTSQPSSAYNFVVDPDQAGYITVYTVSPHQPYQSYQLSSFNPPPIPLQSGPRIHPSHILWPHAHPQGAQTWSHPSVPAPAQTHTQQFRSRTCLGYGHASSQPSEGCNYGAVPPLSAGEALGLTTEPEPRHILDEYQPGLDHGEAILIQGEGEEPDTYAGKSLPHTSLIIVPRSDSLISPTCSTCYGLSLRTSGQ
jgi:hypothetical protein